MTKNKKITCPQCGGQFYHDALKVHLKQHKLRDQGLKGSAFSPFKCFCGERFSSLDAIRAHVNNDEHEIDNEESLCSICGEPSKVRIPHDNFVLCPYCAIGYLDSSSLYGVPLINHMPERYRQITLKKVGTLLSTFDIQQLTDFQIKVVLNIFADNGKSFQFFHDPKGALIFLFSSFSPPVNEEKVFTNVIAHELSHAYLTHKVKLGITDKLKNRKGLTFSQVMAAQLAEDIQLIKVLVANNLFDVINDEAERVSLYFGQVATKPISAAQWQTLDGQARLSSMSSISWTSAEVTWLSATVKDTVIKEKIDSNLKLIDPHYVMHGYPELKKLIVELFNEPISETSDGAEKIFSRLLNVFDTYCAEKSLVVY